MVLSSLGIACVSESERSVYVSVCVCVCVCVWVCESMCECVCECGVQKFIIFIYFSNQMQFIMARSAKLHDL